MYCSALSEFAAFIFWAFQASFCLVLSATLPNRITSVIGPE